MTVFRCIGDNSARSSETEFIAEHFSVDCRPATTGLELSLSVALPALGAPTNGAGRTVWRRSCCCLRSCFKGKSGSSSDAGKWEVTSDGQHCNQWKTWRGGERPKHR